MSKCKKYIDKTTLDKLIDEYFPALYSSVDVHSRKFSYIVKEIIKAKGYDFEYYLWSKANQTKNKDDFLRRVASPHG